MYESKILHDQLQQHCPGIHKKRLNSLMLASQALLDGDQLTLTQLGRHLPVAAKPKHAIKRIDRLLGNSALHRERLCVYQWHATLTMGANPFPIVLVDWADVREQLRFMTLRASVSVSGRSVTIYEQCFEFKRYNSPKSHQLFLDNLALVLPDGCIPIIVTDAGYRNTWFRQVEKFGWYWLGRVRGNVSIKQPKEDWKSNKYLYPKATSKPTYLGESLLSKRSPLSCHAYLFIAPSKGRKAKRHSRTSKKHSASKLYQRSAKEPWLLATNIPTKMMNAVQVVKLYAKRMQIEESFRDLKSPCYGFGLRHNRTKSIQRVDILLLIAMLTEIMLWWLGLIATQAKWQYAFQANTIKSRRVLSTIRLGKELRRRPEYIIKPADIYWSIYEYQRLAHYCGIGDL